MKNYKLDFLGLTGLRELRWPEFGDQHIQDKLAFLYSRKFRDDEHRDGVG
jgi:hypothetical protein